jgi:MFS family permease
VVCCSLGFLTFAFANSLAGLLAAAILQRFAGAVFNPAVPAYLAQAAGARRVEAFALFGVFANAGLLLGPVVGGVLVRFDFFFAGVAAAVAFSIWRWFRRASCQSKSVSPPASQYGRCCTIWREALNNRPFVLVSLGTVGYSHGTYSSVWVCRECRCWRLGLHVFLLFAGR